MKSITKNKLKTKNDKLIKNMLKKNTYITASDLSKSHYRTATFIKRLANEGKFPCLKYKNEIYFSVKVVNQWLHFQKNMKKIMEKISKQEYKGENYEI